MRALPRRRRPGRRDGTGDRRAPDAARRSAADETHQRGAAAQGHASECRPRRRDGGPREVPPDDRADGRAPARSGCPCRRPTAGRSTASSSARASTICSCRPTTSACTCCGAPAIAYRPVTSETPWPTYNGDPGGNRYTTLTQIDKTTVVAAGAEVDVHHTRRRSAAGDAGGRRRHHVRDGAERSASRSTRAAAGRSGICKRPRTKGIAGGGANRGAAVAGDRVFMVTDNAHLLALNRFTGDVLWDTELADWRQNYAASSAPLPAGNLIVSGVSGGEHGANGFVAAFDQETGKEVWRFWTVPKPGDAGIRDVAREGHRARRRPDLVHRQLRRRAGHSSTGRPAIRPRSTTASDRQGDNLYANSILALDRKTGDAQVALPVHAARPLGLGRHADLGARRRGLGGPAAAADAARDRERLLLRVRSARWQAAARQAVRQEPDVGERHRRRRPSRSGCRTRSRRPAGTKVCPSQDGATNWFSPSFNPATGLYYVQTFEKCSIYTKTRAGAVGERQVVSRRIAADRDRSRSRSGSCARSTSAPARSSGSCRSRARRSRGAARWRPRPAWCIFGEDGGALMAADAATGKPLWSFQTNQTWKASPMTYVFDGKQYIARRGRLDDHRAGRSGVSRHGAPQARPPERSGARGPRERRRWGVRRGEAPRLRTETTL